MRLALYVTRGLRGEERQLRWVIAAYLLAATLVWLVPNPMGGNAVRLGALFGGPVLAAVVLARRPRVSAWFLALFLAGGLYWQVTASVSPDRPQRRRPLDRGRPTSSPRPTGCASTAAAGVRVEVPPTANHWESAYLAPDFELARGWLRQLDTTREDIFYARGATSPTPPTAPGCATTRSASSPSPTRRSTTPRWPSGG